MKNIPLIAIIFICASIISKSSYAQVPGAPVGISKGIKAGMNISNFRGDDVENTESRKALIVGGFLKINLLNIMALQPEFLFSRKGAQFEEGSGNTLMEVTYKINYVEIPVLLRLSTIGSGVVNAGLFGGPALAFKVNAKRLIESQGETTEEDLKDIKGTDFGAVIGLGLDLNLGVGSLVGDIRYTWGFNTIDDTSSNLDIKNGVVSVMLGVSL